MNLQRFNIPTPWSWNWLIIFCRFQHQRWTWPFTRTRTRASTWREPLRGGPRTFSLSPLWLLYHLCCQNHITPKALSFCVLSFFLSLVLLVGISMFICIKVTWSCSKLLLVSTKWPAQVFKRILIRVEDSIQCLSWPRRLLSCFDLFVFQIRIKPGRGPGGHRGGQVQPTHRCHKYGRLQHLFLFKSAGNVALPPLGMKDHLASLWPLFAPFTFPITP